MARSDKRVSDGVLRYVERSERWSDNARQKRLAEVHCLVLREHKKCGTHMAAYDTVIGFMTSITLLGEERQGI